MYQFRSPEGNSNPSLSTSECHKSFNQLEISFKHQTSDIYLNLIR
jgi:hypothetical protein